MMFARAGQMRLCRVQKATVRLVVLLQPASKRRFVLERDCLFLLPIGNNLLRSGRADPFTRESLNGRDRAKRFLFLGSCHRSEHECSSSHPDFAAPTSCGIIKTTSRETEWKSANFSMNVRRRSLQT